MRALFSVAKTTSIEFISWSHNNTVMEARRFTTWSEFEEEERGSFLSYYNPVPFQLSLKGNNNYGHTKV